MCEDFSTNVINVHTRPSRKAMSTDINFLFSRELNIAVTYVNTSVQNKKVLGYINLLFINIDMAM